jgi:hypothetical protein
MSDPPSEWLKKGGVSAPGSARQPSRGIHSRVRILSRVVAYQRYGASLHGPSLRVCAC